MRLSFIEKFSFFSSLCVRKNLPQFSRKETVIRSFNAVLVEKIDVRRAQKPRSLEEKTPKWLFFMSRKKKATKRPNNRKMRLKKRSAAVASWFSRAPEEKEAWMRGSRAAAKSDAAFGIGNEFNMEARERPDPGGERGAMMTRPAAALFSTGAVLHPPPRETEKWTRREQTEKRARSPTDRVRSGRPARRRMLYRLVVFFAR